MGIAEHASLGVLSQEGENPLLFAAALGHIVFFYQGIVSVIRNGVEIQIKGDAAIDSQLVDGCKPALHEGGIAGGSNPAAIFGEERAFRNHIKTGEQGQAFVEDGDRKSTRLNSSHSQISYAVFCLKKKNRLRLHTTHLSLLSVRPC